MHCITCAVKSGHAEHCSLVGLPDIILCDHQFDPVPALGLIQPLVGVNGHLCPQGLGQDQHVPHHCIVRPARKKTLGPMEQSDRIITLSPVDFFHIIFIFEI